MSDNEVSVRFSGDVSGLNTAAAQAKGTIAGVGSSATLSAAQLAELTAAIKTAGSSSSSYSSTIRDAAQTTSALASVAGTLVGMGGKTVGMFRDLAVAAAATTYVVKEAGGGLISVAEAAGSAGTALVGLAASGTVGFFREETAAIVAIDAAMGSYVESIGYAQRGAAMFVVANDGVTASLARGVTATTEWLNFTGRISTAVMGAYNSVRLYYSEIERDEVLAISAAGGLKAFGDALGAAGNPGAKDVLQGFNAELEKIPGLTDDGAKSIVTMLTAIPNYTIASTNVLIQYLQTFAKTGDEATKMAGQIKAAFSDQANGGKMLGDIAGTIKNMEALVTVTKDFAASLSPAQAEAMFAAVQKGLDRQKADLQFLDKQNDEALAKQGLLGAAASRLNEIATGEHAAHAQKIADIEHENLLLEVQRQGQVTLTDELKKQGEFRAAIDAASTPSSKINDLTSTRDDLGKNGRRDNDDSEISAQQRDAAIRVAILEAAGETDTGLLAVLNVMKNRLNANYGNYGDNLGDVVSKKGAFSAYDPEKMKGINPDGLQYKRTAALYDQTFGDDAKDDPTNGATHYYNPGAANPNWGSTMGNQTTIGNHKFGNADGAPVPSDGDDTVRKEAIAQANTAIREQNALLAGGTAEEKLKAETAESNLTEARDAVAEAEKLVAVRKAAASAAEDGTPKEQAKANADLVAAQQALADQEVARDKATNALKAAQAQDGSKEKLAIQTAELDAEQSKVAEGSAKYIEIEKQKLELVKTFNAGQAANATETENAKFDALQRGFKEAQDLIKEEAKTRLISATTELADLSASYGEQATMARAHFAELEKINAANPVMVRKYALAGALEENRINQERVQSARAANQQIEQTFRTSFESVGQSVSSSLMAIIEKTGNLRDLLRNVAKNITQQFLDAGIKMVADWAAHQASQIALSVMGQTTQTAAVAAGETARTGLISAGSVAQGAVVVGSMIKSILASAAETFAGIFGFLSPVLGPAAIGPAAAGQATVAAMATIPSYAVGAWDLSGDQFANVHKGEMIIPAGPAAALRSGLTSNAGADGGSVGHTFNFNIDGSKSPAETMAHIRANLRPLQQMLNGQLQNNPSLRR